MKFDSFGHKLAAKRREDAFLYPIEPTIKGVAHVVVSPFERTQIVRSGYDLDSRGFTRYKRTDTNGLVISTVSETGEVLVSREVADPNMQRRKAAKYVLEALSEVASMETDARIPSVSERTFAGAPLSERYEKETIAQQLILLITDGKDGPLYNQLSPYAKEKKFF